MLTGKYTNKVIKIKIYSNMLYLLNYQTFNESSFSGTINSIVETEEFKIWFGDSKIVDKNGNPLMVFHGSLSKDIVKFDINAPKHRNTVGDANGIYFTSCQNTAGNYSRNSNFVNGKIDRSIPKIIGKIYKAYLKMENPLDITPEIRKNDRRKGDKKLPFSVAKRAAQALYDPNIHDGIVFWGNAYNQPEFVVFNPDNIWIL